MKLPPNDDIAAPTTTEERRTLPPATFSTLTLPDTATPLPQSSSPSPPEPAPLESSPTQQPSSPLSSDSSFPHAATDISTPPLSPIDRSPINPQLLSRRVQNPPTTAPSRRSDRIRKFPRHLHDFAAHLQLQPPEVIPEDSTSNLTFKQAQLHPHWRSAMQEEITSIHSNNTWTLVPLPPNTKPITSRWVFKIKPGSNGEQVRYKARLVARGFEQTTGVDFQETFAPVVRWETIRTLLAIAVHLNWPIHQLDVLTAFLNGILKEDVYMVQPPGFVQPGFEHLVCKLHKSLYGLKQSPRAWYARLHAALLAWNLIQSDADPNLYFAHIGKDTIALLVYVDDILITGSNIRLLDQLKHHLHQNFRTNDLGPIRRYLGVQFERHSTRLHMHQTEYALSILQ